MAGAWPVISLWHRLKACLSPNRLVKPCCRDKPHRFGAKGSLNLFDLYTVDHRSGSIFSNSALHYINKPSTIGFQSETSLE